MLIEAKILLEGILTRIFIFITYSYNLILYVA